VQLAIARGVAVCGRLSCWAFRSGSCVIHVEGTVSQHAAIQSFDCFLGLCVCRWWNWTLTGCPASKLAASKEPTERDHGSTLTERTTAESKVGRVTTSAITRPEEAPTAAPLVLQRRSTLPRQPAK